MERIVIEFTRFSAFYSPLISVMSAGFLAEEGLEATHTVSPPGTSAIASLVDGSAQVVQSAPSQGLVAVDRGETPPAVHFAQINERDGFFLAAREPDSAFAWSKLAGREVLVDHGAQPLAMFKYACARSGLDFDAVQVVDAGSPAEMDAAFRGGAGAYVHQQGPAPQQLERDGAGHVVAALGDAVGACAFSSLAATREWLRTDTARAFVRAYAKTRRYIFETPAADIARAEAAFFPGTDLTVLTDTIAAYQRLGCWTPHVEITREALEATQAVFLHAGVIARRHPYESVCSAPPGL